jgi:signal transduction histidine kinase
VPAHGWVDREMWEKIILNLLSNAFKFTMHGTITVQLVDVGERLRLTVADTGIGMPKDSHDRVFERFYRVESAHGRSHEGSGIGLALVHELVKLHGGSISVCSELHRGSTFAVEFPGACTPAALVESDAAAALEHARRQLRRRGVGLFRRVADHRRRCRRQGGPRADGRRQHRPA